MMSSATTLTLSAELKARIAAAAQQSGKSEHAFVVGALLARAVNRRQATIIP